MKWYMVAYQYQKVWAYSLAKLLGNKIIPYCSVCRRAFSRFDLKMSQCSWNIVKCSLSVFHILIASAQLH